MVIYPFLSFNTSFSFFASPLSLVTHLIPAMSLQRSQFVWFRKIHMLVSSYMVHNSFKEIPAIESHK